ncbi:MAG TPA: TIGR03792 family protein [Acidimicrobiales bacterium]|nr:TIGR03792 family protein [Acidimicrobiales bacterium]
MNLVEPGAAVEVLEFAVEPHLRDRWLEVERDTWTEFLRRQPGFVHKQVWLDPIDESRVTVVIWWASRAQWKQITPEQVAAVDAEMGEWFRDSALREHVVRSTWGPSGSVR